MAKATTKGIRFNLPEEFNQSLRTSEFRCSYAHLAIPWSGDEDKTPRYSVQMIFEKNDKFIRKAKSLVKKIAIEAFGPTAVKLLQRGKLHNPFRSGDDEFGDDELYQGKVFVNANGSFEGKKPTGIYDQKLRDMRKVFDSDELQEKVYSGMYARAEIKFFPYDREGGKGIACYLFRVQKIRNGEPLGGGKPVSEIFDEVETDDDDEYGDLNTVEEDDDF